MEGGLAALESGPQDALDALDAGVYAHAKNMAVAALVGLTGVAAGPGPVTVDGDVADADVVGTTAAAYRPPPTPVHRT